MKRILFVVTLLLSLVVNGQTLMINEISQGTGASEYVELVVVGQATCLDSCMDLRHMIFDDNNGTFASGTGKGIAQGAMRFSNSNFWKCVPYGTIIVLYNPASPNPYVPSDDFSLTDDHVLVLPTSSNLLEWTNTKPTTLDATYPLGVLFWGTPLSTSWTSSLSMNNTNDSFQVRDSNGVLLHSISWGNNTTNTMLFFTAAIVYSFNNTTTNNFLTPSNWGIYNDVIYQTPGVPNTPENTIWINNMFSITPITLGNINHN